MKQLKLSDYQQFIDAIGHSPKTAIPVHLLRNNLAEVHFLGEPNNFEAAVVVETKDCSEPTTFGRNASAIWQIFSQLEGWGVINLDSEVASDVGDLLKQSDTYNDYRLYGDWYYALNQPVELVDYPDKSIQIRLLTSDDITLCESAPESLRPRSYGTLSKTLEKGINAGAIVDGQLVAMAESHRAGKHLNVGVYTDEQWRNHGLSTAVANLVCAEGQSQGLIPVWSTGEDNFASQRVAEKLSMEKVAERLYIIPVQTQS